MSIIFKDSTLLLLLFLILSSCQSETKKADLIISNANIWTGSEKLESTEAMAIVNDKILAIGTDEEIIKHKGPNTNVVDAAGRFITPGFIDCHVHLISGGRSLLSVELRDADTREEFTRRIAEYTNTLEAGEWIMEGNWDHTLWGGELPHKTWIDENTSDNPTALFRLDGHMLLANTAALNFAGITETTPDVEGGEIVRDANGQPTGMLKDNAMNLLLDKMPPMTQKQKALYFKAAMDYFLSHGVTSVHDVDGLSPNLESYTSADKLRKKGELAVRIYGAKPLNLWEELFDDNRESDVWYKTGNLKGFVDGSLGSHTAAFHDVYSDKADDKGFFIFTKEDLYDWISSADKANLHIMVHAIGDDAIHTLLNIYERVVGENGKRDRRLRIEHAQHIAPEDINRFAELGVIASMQPYHAIDDGRWAEELIGPERIKTTYAFKSLLDSGAKVAFGSDWAVAPAAPLQGIYGAVTRRTLDDKNPDGWVPEEKISVEQALIAYTRDAAYASFEEDIKGTLELGKLADFVVLNHDITKVDLVQIQDIKVLQTYVGGKKMYEFKE